MRTVVVGVKHVPVGGAFLRVTDGKLTRDGVSHGLDPVNEVALEWAIRCRESDEVDRIVAVTLGPPDADAALRQAYALGADEVIHVCDDQLAGADVRTTARVLASVVRLVAGRLLIVGYESLDASSGATPAAAAELLGWPLVSRLGDGQLDGELVHGERDLGSGAQTVEVELPAVLSVVAGRVLPRYPKLKRLLAAKSAQIVRLGAGDVGVARSADVETSIGLFAVPQAPRHPRYASLDEGVEELLALLTGGGPGG